MKNRSPRVFRIRKPDFRFDKSQESEREINLKIEESDKTLEKSFQNRNNLFLNPKNKPEFLQSPNFKRFILSNISPKNSRSRSPELFPIEKCEKKAVISKNFKEIKESLLNIFKKTGKNLKINEKIEFSPLPKHNLAYFDLQKDLSPDDWLKNSNNGQIKSFKNGKYELSQVKILNYNKNTSKYHVIDKENKEKIVSRLALKFESELNKDYNKRINDCHKLKSKEKEAYRFNEYVDKIIDNSFLTTMPENVKFSVLERLKLKEFSFNNPIIAHILKILFLEVENSFLQFQKLFICYDQMTDKNNLDIYKNLEIKIRKIYSKNMYYGCLFKNYGFKMAVKKLNWSKSSKENQIYKAFLLINCIPESYLKKKISFNKENNSFPLDIDIFDKEIKNLHYKNRDLMHRLWRQYLVEEIQLQLSPIFNFFQEKNYFGSELERILRKMEFILTNVFQTYFMNCLTKYLDFLNSFKSKSISLLYLTIEYNNKNELFLNPKYEEILSIFFKPIELLIETANSIPKLQHSLLPLIKIRHSYFFQWNKNSNPDFLIKASEINTIICKNLEIPNEILSKLKKFEFLMQNPIKKMLSDLFDLRKKIDFDNFLLEIKEKLSKFNSAIWEIPKIIVPISNYKLFELEISKIKNLLIKKAQKSSIEILKRLDQLFVIKLEELILLFETLNKNLSSKPESESKLVELREKIEKVPSFLLEMSEKDKLLAKIMVFFDEYLYELSQKTFELYYYLKSWPSEIQSTLKIAKNSSILAESLFLEHLSVEKKEFSIEISNLFEKFESIKKYSNFKYIKEESLEVSQLKEKLEKSLEHAKKITYKEEILHQEITLHDSLLSLASDFEPFSRLWELVLEFDMDRQLWLNDSFIRLNYVFIERKIEGFLKETLKLQKIFIDKHEESASKVIKSLKEDIEKFRSRLWIVEFLTNEAVLKKPSVWKDVFRECELAYIEPNNEMTLTVLIDHGIVSFREKIEEIAKRVEKQWNFEKKIVEIQEKLKMVRMEIVPYKKTGAYILKSGEEIQNLIDEDLSTILLMKASPYSKPIIQKIRDLETRIVLIQDTLENILELQMNWIYLEPIFASDDFQENMSNEKKSFERRDSNFRILMSNFLRENSLWDNIENDKLKLELEEDNRVLGIIQRNLSNYLESKRLSFPRFFFLSDEELLEILSHTKDPITLQLHISKCFEGISKLLISDSIHIKGIESIEGEKLMFSQEVIIEGKVENWLSHLEIEMKRTMEQTLRICLQHGEHVKRTQWVFEWPGQCILVINALKWTKKVEENLIDTKDLRTLFNFLTEQLSLIVDCVQIANSPLQRKTLEALIVMDVHHKDIVDLLVKNQTNKISDFLWQSQLRYYYEDVLPLYIEIQLIYAKKTYGFEYLGNSSRLVITPLNDRCFRTLFSAYYHNYGGGPEGPAGTGKTESVKDLAKTTGCFCLVFNCSESLNHHAVLKLLKGISSTGSFICFDEFNRIPSDVLSIIAQHILAIQNTIREHKNYIIFDEQTLKISSNCCINITMNPNYAGRSQLPENLKSLFRPCSMMIPDYGMIAEIYLFSVGFHKARELSKKLVWGLQLCSEQLSAEEHYDFGMRALKTILTAAAEIKRLEKIIGEEAIVMRALIDINLPKFTSQDIPLFNNIISDLFKNEEIKYKDDIFIENILKQSAKEINLVDSNEFILKCMQLYNTLNVRNGIMVIGPTYSGKTMIINTLKQTFFNLNKNNQIFSLVNLFKLNPKAITLPILYGVFESETKIWDEGVLPLLLRDLQEDFFNWIIFDGPVDSHWIENLNTVLDDNKKLCLASGEIIKLSKKTTLFFEVEHLHYASPATISRCGMIYLESNNINWKMLIKVSVTEDFYYNIENIIEKCVYFFEKKAKFVLTIGILPIIKTFLQIFNELIRDEETDTSKAIIFSIIWSFGAVLTELSKYEFSIHLLEILKFFNFTSFLPASEGRFFEFFLEKKSWKPWSSLLDGLSISRATEYQNLIIPNLDYLRLGYYINLFYGLNTPVLVCGSTGTGKSLFLNTELKRRFGVEKENNDSSLYLGSFFGHTTSIQLQKIIEGRISVRLRKNVYGSEEGKKAVIFLDDINLPEKDEQGAVPCLELLRQQLDCGGFYDLESKEFKKINDSFFVSAFTTNSNEISNRLLRHYSVFSLESLEEESINRIFNHVLEWIFMNMGLSLSKLIKNMREKLVLLSVKLLMELRKCTNLLPIPSKPHYLWTMRDISRIFAGIGRSNPKTIRIEEDMIRLWTHETLRVFEDRLVNKEDVNIFTEILQTQTNNVFPSKKNQDRINVLFGILTNNGNYSEIKDQNELKKICEEYLREKNMIEENQHLNLVLFKDALNQVLRILRIIGNSGGHLVLIGVGGSGRKSLTMLASHIGGLVWFGLEHFNWNEEKKRIFSKLASESRPLCVFIREEGLEEGTLLEDITYILKGNDLTNILSLEDRILALENLQGTEGIGTLGTKIEVLNKKMRQNLHIVLCISASGNTLRKKIRLFPSIIHLTTVNWFRPWPEDALQMTAESFLIEKQGEGGGFFSEIQGKFRTKVVEIWLKMYSDIQSMSLKLFRENRANYFITPNLFLDCLNIFYRLLVSRGEKTAELIEKYDIGLEKLKQTEDEVYRMHKILEDLKPKLSKMTFENNQMLQNLRQKQEEADEKLKFCEQEEKETDFQKKESDDLRNECKQELDRVLPLLQEAAAALNKISKDDLTKIRSYANPPKAVDIVMQGICLILEEDVNVKLKTKNDGSMEKYQDFWEFSKKHLLNDKLIKRIQKFKEEQIRKISHERLVKLKQILLLTEFEKEKVFKSSTAAGNLSIWIRTVIETNEALKVVDPKKIQLQQAESKYKKTVALLKEKKKALSAILSLIHELEKEYEIAKKEQQNLQSQVDDCTLQLQRAEQLMFGLAVEKDSWKKKGIQCRADSKALIGDVLLCAGIIAFFGFFPPFYRDTCLTSWKNLLKQYNIVFSTNFTFQNILSDPIKLSKLINEEHLPNDDFSIDNALLVENCEHWPLLIDPQKQGSIWIKEKEKGNKLLLLRNSQSLSEIVFNLENAIQFGFPLLLENIGEELDGIYMPLIQVKRFAKKKKDRIKALIGAKQIEISSDFRIYFASKLSKPNFSAEVCVNLTFINFNVTKEALEDQMLNIVVQREEPEKEEQRLTNLKEFTLNRDKLRITENEILRLITESKNDILQDEAFIDILKRSKHESGLIEEKLGKAENDQKTFNKIRSLYTEPARRVANLFFILIDLANIEFMYQFSMEFHVNIYHQAISNTSKIKKAQRINMISQTFTSLFYEYIVRSLLEKHKLVFSFLILLRITQYETFKLTANEIRFLMLGGTSTEKEVPKELKNHFTKKQWGSLLEISNLDSFNGFCQDYNMLINDLSKYLSNYKEVLPGQWHNKINQYQKLLLIRILKPDKLINYIHSLISEDLGQKFLESTPFTLFQSFQESNSQTPIILILSPGVDPLLDLYQVCDKFSNRNNLIIRALGKGQAESSLSILKKAMKEGKWVLLQNCHLACQALLPIEKALETEESNKDFRLWLSSMPSNNFPVELLQKGVKMSFESAKGIKNNILSTLFRNENVEENSKNEGFKRCLFALAFFHAVIVERKRFGPLGWNVNYEFSLSDFSISKLNLSLFFENQIEIDWKAINYIVAEMNYGGRVIDPLDQRLIRVILDDFLTEETLKTNYIFCESKIYYIPKNIDGLKSYVNNLPIDDVIDIFGLHENAEISCSIIEGNNLCERILELLPNNSIGASSSIEAQVKEKCQIYLKKLPDQFEISEIQLRFPIKYEDSMNSVLIQELMKFNKLLEIVNNSLNTLCKAIDGIVLMNSELEDFIQDIWDNKVPILWKKISYASDKALGSWFVDFLNRIVYMKKWSQEGCPKDMWISGLYFPQGFLTGVQQNFARKHKKSIENIEFKFEIDPLDRVGDFIIYGIFLEGGFFDLKNKILTDPLYGSLIFKMPKIALISIEKDENIKKKNIYECPVYRTSQRAGLLSTTGRSNNYLMTIDLPIDKESSILKWIKRGVALLTQTN